jgi:hypothetical protein
MQLIWVRRETKYFCKRGWTSHFGKHEVICPTGKISWAVRLSRQPKADMGHHSRTERPEMLIAGNKAGARVNRGSISPCQLQPFCRALISSNLESARSNLPLKSHIASRISRKVADVLALSACPKAKMLLFRRYPMILGSEIL